MDQNLTLSVYQNENQEMSDQRLSGNNFFNGLKNSSYSSSAVDCGYCSSTILGYGYETNGQLFCCENCLKRGS